MADNTTSSNVHPLAMDGKDPSLVRGDEITRDRYYSREFMEREWEHLWTKIWHVGGREQQLQMPGDYIVHDFMTESIIIARQRDGSLRGYYNTCAHRGQRLAWDSGSQEQFVCPYHGWTWGLDGTLVDLPDRDDFPQGDPCGTVRLVDVRVDTWGGLVWWTMDDEAPDLLDYLEPVPDIYRNHQFDKTVRVQWIRVALNCNWKFSSDNFNESYHTRTAHPQVPPIIDQDHFTSRYEMYPMGHARIVQLGRPSLRDVPADGQTPRFDDLLRKWDVDPESYPDYETKVVDGWLDLKAAKRRLWREKGYLHLEHLSDEELTESPFQTIFPNIALGAGAEYLSFYRWEPHATDPEKCYFDVWSLAHPIAGQEEFVKRTATVPVKMEEAEFDFREYDGGLGVIDLSDTVVFQDWQLSAGQQAGWRSRGYQEPYMASQETRVRRFHEVLHDYLDGNPPGR